jgi:hypothetical protein
VAFDLFVRQTEHLAPCAQVPPDLCEDLVRTQGLSTLLRWQRIEVDRVRKRFRFDRLILVGKLGGLARFLMGGASTKNAANKSPGGVPR